jgi:Archaeal ADP-dependent phosphofructokinase/glucokinase
MRESWQRRVAQVVAQRPKARTFSAFNLNVDVIARVTPQAIQRLIESAPELDWQQVAEIHVDALRGVRTREEFVAVLRHGFKTGKSILLVRETEEFVPWWREVFHDRDESMGGQAGIIANQMAALGATSVVYSPLLSPRQAQFFVDGVVWPVVREGRVEYLPAKEAGRPQDLTREPWVFEFVKGATFQFPDEVITTPRANRAIITMAGQGPERRFHDDIYPALAELGSQLDVAFLAGYHQCGARPDDPEAVRAYIERSCADIEFLKSRNPSLKIHVEYVPTKVREIETDFYRRLGSVIHSFGINETETRSVMRRYGQEALAKELEEDERAYPLYKSGLFLLRELGVERVHIHNLGYYVVVLRKPYHCPPAIVRDGCLFASAVNARKAQVGGFIEAESLPQVAGLPLSDIGIQQLERFTEEVSQKEPALRPVDDGVWEASDHFALVVPTHVVPNPVVTVGMGDTISSSSYYYEVSEAQK